MMKVSKESFTLWNSFGILHLNLARPSCCVRPSDGLEASETHVSLSQTDLYRSYVFPTIYVIVAFCWLNFFLLLRWFVDGWTFWVSALSASSRRQGRGLRNRQCRLGRQQRSRRQQLGQRCRSQEQLGQRQWRGQRRKQQRGRGQQPLGQEQSLGLGQAQCGCMAQRGPPRGCRAQRGSPRGHTPQRGSPRARRARRRPPRGCRAQLGPQGGCRAQRGSPRGCRAQQL